MKDFAVRVLVGIIGFALGFSIGYLWCSLGFVNSHPLLRSWIISTVVILPIAIFSSNLEIRLFWRNIKSDNHLAPFSVPFWFGYIGYLYYYSKTLG